MKKNWVATFIHLSHRQRALNYFLLNKGFYVWAPAHRRVTEGCSALGQGLASEKASNRLCAQIRMCNLIRV